jgi:Na+/proline symporter
MFGKRVRRMGLNLNAHTFPEFLGRRYESTFLQGSTGLLIFVFMPLYAGVVLMGGPNSSPRCSAFRTTPPCSSSPSSWACT